MWSLGPATQDSRLKTYGAPRLNIRMHPCVAGNLDTNAQCLAIGLHLIARLTLGPLLDFDHHVIFRHVVERDGTIVGLLPDPTNVAACVLPREGAALADPAWKTLAWNEG